MSGPLTWTWYTQYPDATTGTIGYTGVGVQCDQPTLDILGATAALGRVAHAPQAAAAAWSVTQHIYFFPNKRSAQAAYTTLSGDLAHCETTTAGTAPGTHRTAGGDDMAAWAEYPTPDATAMVLYENHSYLVQRGPLVTVLTFGTATGGAGTPNPGYTAVNDNAVLAAIGTSLANVAGN